MADTVSSKRLPLSGFEIANDRPLVVIGGINVIESRDLALKVAETFKAVTERLGMPYVFKATFDKANRSSILDPILPRAGPGRRAESA